MLLSFVAGSSVLAFLPTFLYVGHAWRTSAIDKGQFPYALFSILVPVFFGLANVVANRIPSKSSKGYTIKMAITGAIFGLVLSIIGSRFLDIPEKLNAFGWPDKPWLPVATAWLLYALIWVTGINALNRYLGIANFPK